MDTRAQAVSELSVEVRTLENAVESQTELIERRQERLSIDADAVSDEQLAAATDTAAQTVTEQQRIVSASRRGGRPAPERNWKPGYHD